MLIPIRDENPASRLPILTTLILATNVAAFLYAKLLGTAGFDALTASFGAIPFEITHGVDAISPTPFSVYATLVTSMFMHGGWLHIGGNMLYLWIFGNNVEDALGHARFLVFYLFCGVVATLAHIATAPESMIPLVGASGAIAGVLGAYMAAFPGARVQVLVPILFFIQIIRVPAVLVLGVWFIVQLVNASMDAGGMGGGVAWFAHIGGFVVGFLLMRRRRKRVRVEKAW